jgi:hypothetical protein
MDAGGFLAYTEVAALFGEATKEARRASYEASVPGQGSRT